MAPKTVNTSEALRQRTRTQLAEVEGELQDSDRCDDELTKHAGDARSKIDTELKRRRGQPMDEDAEAEYLWLHGQRRRAQRVDEMGARERARR